MPGGWWRFWRWRRAPLAEVRVVVYTRAGCHVCDEAARFLEGERRRLGFTLEYIDIDQNAELRERHGEWVPVVEVEGRVRFRGRVNPVLWSRLVTALGRGGTEPGG